MKIFIILAAVIVVVAMSLTIDRPENWVFDPKVLKKVANHGIKAAHSKYGANATAEQVVECVIKEVIKTYPQHTSYTGRWLWNNAGGAMGSMTVLHSSFSEYLIIFGTAVGTEGHTGRYHWAEDFFTVLYGEQWAALPNIGKAEVYGPGDQHYLTRRTAKQYRMPGACWALEYARGNIPSMLFFGLADTFSSTLDFVTLARTVGESAGGMINSAIQGKV